MSILNSEKLKNKARDKVAEKVQEKAIEKISGFIPTSTRSALEGPLPSQRGSSYTVDKEDTAYIDQSIDQLIERLPLGSVNKAISNNLYGINFRQNRNAVPRAKDNYGFTFFTRPQLNLRTFNITNFRQFYSLLTDNPLSYQRYTRMMLDPRLEDLSMGEGISSPLVNNESAFIPILSNNLESLSGWPDLQVPTHTSNSGLYGEEMSFVDGVSNHFESFDIDVTFRNTLGNPLIYFFWVWVKYQSLVFEGILNPYTDMVAENEIDYNTRIYRLVMDKSKRYVTYIGCTGASFPTNVPTGNLFDFNADTPYNTSNREINIRFRSMGFMAFEDLIKLKFNETSAMFSPAMRKLLNHDLGTAYKNDRGSVLREDPTIIHRIKGSTHVKIPNAYMYSYDASYGNIGVSLANHKAHPYINLYTNELEWWVDERYFDGRMSNETEEQKENSKKSLTGIVDEYKQDMINSVKEEGKSKLKSEGSKIAKKFI